MSEETAMPQIDIGNLITDIKRYARSALLVGALVSAAIIIPVINADSKYTSTSSIMLDPRSYNDIPNEQVVSDLPADTTQMDTEVEVLKSTALASAVITDLQLDKDPEFNPELQPKKNTVQSPITTAQQSQVAQRYKQQQILNRVLGGISVKRQGLTRIINVSYTSLSPEKSSKILDYWLRAYLQQQVSAKISGTQKANELVGQRLNELRMQVEQADAQLQNYKIANGLLSTDGKGLAEQEISNYSQQVAQAKADVAQAQAKLDTAKQQLRRGSLGDDVGEALNSPVIQNLRRLRAEVSKDYAELDSRYGPRHPEILKTKQQLADIDNQIRSEIGRIVSNLSAQVAVQQQRLSSLENSLNGTKNTLKANNLASVGLKELETNAESVRAVYQSYLDKYKETAAAEGNAKPDARVVSPPNLPIKPSEPKVMLTIALALVVGLLSAILTIIIRRLLNSGITYGEEIESQLNTAHIASIPSVNSTLPMFKKFDGSPLSYLKQKPLSIFAEGLRSLRAALLYSKLGSGAKIIAITSALPGEGKTTTTLCLAEIMASSGQRVLVVDCDLRKHSISNAFKSAPDKGLIEFISGEYTLEEVLFTEKNGISHLPIAKDTFTAKDIFGSEAMKVALEKMSRKFDVVLLDTAPVMPVVESRILARQADATVLLVQWRKTPKKILQTAIDTLNESGAKLVGVAINQLDVKQASHYGYNKDTYYRSYGSKSYFNS